MVSPISLSLDITSKLLEELETEQAFSIPGTSISIDEGTVVQWIIIAILSIIAFIFTRNLKVDGEISKRQLFIEMCVEKIYDFFHKIVGDRGKKYIPWLMTVAVYIGACNMAGVIGYKAPTRELNVTAGLALTSILLVQIAGIQQLGVGGWLKSYAKPVAVVLPINLMEILIKPMSLCFRLFGNVLGAFIIMKLLESVVPIVLPVALSCYFDIFDGFIQAYVFCFLTALYVSEAIEE